MDVSRLLIPALRADGNGSFADSEGPIRRALESGVGGFILFGGEAASVSRLIRELRASSAHPLLIGSDLERGAGQQFAGATRLPPAGAIGHLGDLAATRRAGEITGREARSIGIDCVFAPVADIDLEPRNPIIGTRAFGSTTNVVTGHVAAWIEGCHEGGSIACAKHFPGHGRTTGDSHLTLPKVAAPAGQLHGEMEPFGAAVAAGAAAVMTAHVSYPQLDSAGVPATLSRPILHGLLREALGFTGLVVTDGLGMAGLTGRMSEGEAAVAALAAGCDLLLYPTELGEVADALEMALSNGRLSTDEAKSSIARLDHVLGTLEPRGAGEWGRAEDRRWARELAMRSLVVLAGDPQLEEPRVRLLEIDDDAGALMRPRQRELAEILIAEGCELGATGQPLVALYADVHAGKKVPGISDRALESLEHVLAESPQAPVVLFGHPRFASQIPHVQHLLCAWGGERPMQEAAARWLRSGR